MSRNYMYITALIGCILSFLGSVITYLLVINFYSSAINSEFFTVLALFIVAPFAITSIVGGIMTIIGMLLILKLFGFGRVMIRNGVIFDAATSAFLFVILFFTLLTFEEFIMIFSLFVTLKLIVLILFELTRRSLNITRERGASNIG